MTKFVTPKGTAVWPHLNTPDTKFVTEGEYHTKLRIPADEAQPLIEQLEDIRKAYLAEAIRKDPKVKQFKMADLYEEEVDDQGDLTGNYLFKFKQKAVINTRAGTTLNMKVALFDSQKKPTDVSIGGGSVIRVAATAIGYAMPSTKMVGLSLRPSAIQIIELSGGAGAGADVFAVEDGFVGDGVTETKDEVPVFHGEDDADF
jgi:hypothetical protein